MSIREQADLLLKRSALLQALEIHGAQIVGSYAMDAMSWNDLDIYVETDQMSVSAWSELSARVIRAVQPVRIDGFQDASAGKFFLGVETMITGERWNIDIWGKSKAEIADAVRRNRDMKARFDAEPDAREAMLRIKRALIEKKMYGFDKGREHFHSPKIYDAVLEKGVRTIEEFLEK